jgi:predicted trehalose synthase
MKLTLKQFQQNTEDRLTSMAARLDRAERNGEELHIRLDRYLINSENRAVETRSYMDDFRNEMRIMGAEMTALMNVLNSTFTNIEQRLTRIEEWMPRIEERLSNLESRK